MLDIHRGPSPDAKTLFSHSLLPAYLDPHNVSAKKKPFSTFGAQPFTHTLDLILPQEIYEIVRERLEEYATGCYARVYMRLGEVLEGEFLGGYVKKGNVMMLSQGRPLVDNIFSLYEGVLRLELDRPSYERCGLQGRPIEDGGRKHQKGRWVVEYDLRLPSMAHGKKGFSRLEWACKNVLNQSLTWLFYNANPSSGEALKAGKEPISIHHPSIHTLESTVTELPQTLVPRLTPADLTNLYDQEDALALHEYLDLLSLASPRVCALDALDPHLSRYEVPTFFPANVPLESQDMVRVRWRGFIAPHFVRDLFLAVRRDGLRVGKAELDAEGATQGAERRWIAMSAVAFGGNAGWSVLQWAGRETLVWECAV